MVGFSCKPVQSLTPFADPHPYPFPETTRGVRVG